jgi:sugar (glycoside-pentoside-hexuronide) transporter
MGNELKPSVKNLYGLPSFGFQVFVSLEIFFFAVFLTDFAMLPIALVGTVLLVTSIFDILWVPTSGILLEKSNMKWGKYRSWLLVGPPLAVLFFMMQFAKVGSVSINALVIIVGFVVSHLIWNIFYTAHLALNSALTTVREERVAMASNRGMFNAAGAITFSLLLTPYLKGATAAPQFTLTALIGGITMLASYYVLFYLTKDYAFHGTAQPSEVKEKMQISEMLKQIVVNPPLLGMLFGDLGRYIGRFVIFGMAVYYVRYVVQNMAILTILFTGLNVALFAGAAIAAPIAKKIGERNTYILSLLIFITGLLVVYLFPLNSTSFLVVIFITYLGYGMPDAVGVAMYSNTVEYGEWKTGKNARGFIMSLFAFPIKVAILIRGVIITAVLASASYVANMDATPELINALKTGFALVPVIFLVISLLFILFLYKITPQSLKLMQTEIAARKKGTAA